MENQHNIVFIGDEVVLVNEERKNSDDNLFYLRNVAISAISESPLTENESAIGSTEIFSAISAPLRQIFSL